MLSVAYAECCLCWVLRMLSVTYAECHLCWASHVSLIFWVSLCWMSLCWVSLCWMALCWVSWRLLYNLAQPNLHLTLLPYTYLTQQQILNVNNVVRPNGRLTKWPSTFLLHYFFSANLSRQPAISSTCHLVSLPFWQLAISSTSNFTKLPFCQLAI
jgi:hypothetical protein